MRPYDELYKLGLTELIKGGYKNKLKAISYLNKSVRYKYDNNPLHATMLDNFLFLLNLRINKLINKLDHS